MLGSLDSCHYLPNTLSSGSIPCDTLVVGRQRQQMNEIILCVHPTMTAIVGRPLRVWHVENSSVAFGNVLDFFFLRGSQVLELQVCSIGQLHPTPPPFSFLLFPYTCFMS